MMTTLKDLALGDHVRMWTISGHISTQKHNSDGVTDCFIIGDSEGSDTIVLGWKPTDPNILSKGIIDSNTRNLLLRKFQTHEKLIFINDFDTYESYRIVGYHCEAELIATRNTDSPKSNSVSAPIILPQWKMFQNSVPGECPCGAPRITCPYHKP